MRQGRLRPRQFANDAIDAEGSEFVLTEAELKSARVRGRRLIFRIRLEIRIQSVREVLAVLIQHGRHIRPGLLQEPRDLLCEIAMSLLRLENQ